jgi:hypothetical protein
MDPSPSPLFHVNILRQYINALIVNVKPSTLPKEVNLIFDSGAVNGLLGIGAALYIHHLEKNNFMTINKISGCSIGSLIAVWYSCGCPDAMYAHTDTLFSYYKQNKNFFIYAQIVTDIIHRLFPNDEAAIQKLNERLYINYYDTKKCKQRVVSKFKNRAHLITCIIRSSHIPFLTNKCHKYQGRYVDGVAPYIFPSTKSCKNLFIQLINFTDMFAMGNALNIKREKNIYSRLIRGVVETNEFFINDSSTLCCYVNYKTKLQLYMRRYFIIFVLSLVDYFIFLKNTIPSAFKETDCYNKLCLAGQLSWMNILDRLT